MRQKHWKKRITACILLAAMAVATISGCGSRQKDSSRQEENRTGKESESQTEDKSSEGTIARGRYVESKVELPVEQDTMGITDIVEGADGTLRLFARNREGKGSIEVYEYNGSTWSLVSADYLNKIPAEAYGTHVAYGPDGATYVTYKDSQYKDHLAKVSDSLDLTEIPLEISNDMIVSFQTTENGTLLISLLWNTLVMKEDGTVVRKLPHKASWSDFCDSFTVTPASFLAAGDQGFIRYNAESGEEKEVIPYQTDENDIFGSLAAGEGEDFYLCNPAGIHHMTEYGTIWETVVDGTLTSLGMPSIIVKRLFTGTDHDFYVWYVENEKAGLVHYTYDADMPSVPSKNLTIYGLDLSENKTIRQAASLFQMANPDVRVEVIDGHSDAGGISPSDTIRALNTELINGKGADILVLDGLPARSYMEKGILEDMQKVIRDLSESGELYANLAENFYQKDGSIYQIPSRLSFPIIIADQDKLGHYSTLESLGQFQKDNPEIPLLTRSRYENMLREMGNLYYTELVDLETGQLIPGKVKTLLETVKVLGEASGAKVIFDDSEDGGRGTVFNMGTRNATINSGVLDLFMGERLISIELLKSMNDMMLPFGAMDTRGYSMEQLNGSYFPLGMLGVTSTGKEKETAMEFIRFTLGSQVQGSDLRDGFPVNPKAADLWLERESDSTVSIGRKDIDEPLIGHWPSPAQRQEIMNFAPGLNQPICVDAVLMEMIINESKGYFEGTQTADQAAAAVENKAKLYEAEQQ